MNNKKVAVALSGGVDSAVSALLLKKQGYEVIGVTCKMTNSPMTDAGILKAEVTAKQLEIPFFVVDATNEFQKNVTDYFINSYKNGLTPNPCIMCNKYIKWGVLYDYVFDDLKADYLATGHYANICCKNNIYQLYPAKDTLKDQLYFLFLLNQKQLSKTLFPLSDYTKDEIRNIAAENNLPQKSSKESQDICFIQAPMTTKKYLNNIFSQKSGNFVNKEGKILGKHDGYWQYTIGQRKGIGIADTEALYVTKIHPETNSVTLGYKKDLYTKVLNLDNVNWVENPETNEFEVLVKIRYNMKQAKAKVVQNKDAANVIFEEPVSAIARGQACVFYDIKDGHLLGGGWI